ncbi:MAG: signal transduction protein with CBS protein [archaeon GW2011_AR5]|nr:MAG: signal transduction protein with CBS protein [archaeon GW2011_AR5]
MRIKDIMTKRPVTVKPDDTFGKAVRLMTGRNISGCPVVKDGKLIGIVTQTDAVRAIDIYGKINRSDISSLLISILKSKGSDPARLRKLFKARVSDIMNRKVISVDVERDVYEAARLMNKHGIDRLPVVKSSQLVGIVTKKDILRLLEKVNN